MHWNRIVAVFFAVLTWAIASLVWLEMQYLGFPDGYLSELDRAKQFIYSGFGLVSFATGGWLFYLGFACHTVKLHHYLLLTLMAMCY